MIGLGGVNRGKRTAADPCCSSTRPTGSGPNDCPDAGFTFKTIEISGSL